MADIKKSTGPNPLDELKWFLGILFLLGLLWFISGGYKREEAPKPFIQSPTENIGAVQTQ